MAKTLSSSSFLSAYILDLLRSRTDKNHSLSIGDILNILDVSYDAPTTRGTLERQLISLTNYDSGVVYKKRFAYYDEELDFNALGKKNNLSFGSESSSIKRSSYIGD